MGKDIQLTDEQAGKLNRALAGEAVDLTDEEASLLNDALGAAQATPEPAAPAAPDVPAGGIPPLLARPDENTVPAAGPGATLEPPQPLLAPPSPDETALDLAFKDSQGKYASEAARALAVANRLGMPVTTVRENLSAFDAAAKAAGWNARRFINDNPVLADIILHNPQLGAPALVTKELGDAMRGWEQSQAYWDAPRSVEAIWKSGEAATPDEALAIHQKELSAWEAARAKAVAPVQVEEVDNAQAQALREGTGGPATFFGASKGPLAILGRRADEAQAQNTISKMQYQLMMLKARKQLQDEAGRDSLPKDIAGWALQLDPVSQDTIDALSAKLQEAELAARPLRLGDDSGALHDASIAMQGITSSLETAKDAAKAAPAGAVAGAAVAGALGALGAVVTGNPELAPAAARSAAIRGALAGVKLGAKAGAVLSIYTMEAGSTAKDLSQLVTEDGNRLTDVEIAGASALAGAFKAALEEVGFEAQMKPLTELLPEGLGGQMKALLSRNRTFREKVAHLGQLYVTGVLKETATETLQEGVDQAAKYFAASLKDERFQMHGPDTRAMAQAGEGGFFGAALGLELFTSAAHPFVQAATRGIQAVEGARNEVGDRGIPHLLKLAEQETVRAQPDAFAAGIADAAQANGKPLTAVHVDVKALDAVLAQQGLSEAQKTEAITQALGQDGPERAAVARAEGSRIEVPMQDFLGHFGNTDLAKKLVLDMATSAEGQTPRERMDEAAAQEKEAQALAQEAIKKGEDELAFTEAMRAREEQLRKLDLPNVTESNIIGISRLQAEGITTMAKKAGLGRGELATRLLEYQKGDPFARLSPDDVRTLFQGEEEKVAQPPADGGGVPGYDGPIENATLHGYTTFAASTEAAKVFLNPTADFSTLVHETGHVFLNLARSLGEVEGATEESKADWAAIREWLGVPEGTTAFTRSQHELWARTFEAYLADGRTPKKSLETVFARAKKWMLDIYQAVGGISGARLDEKSRAIFDALLATRQEAEAYRRAQGMDAAEAAAELARKADEKGKDAKARAEAAQASDEVEREEGSRRAELAAVKDRLRELESGWKKEARQLRAKYEAEYEGLSARKAQRFLSGDRGEGLRMKPIALNRAQVEGVLGKGVKLEGIELSDTGARADSVARQFGYPNGTSLIAALGWLPSQGEWAQVQSEAEMRRLHPGVLEEQARLRKLVADGLNSYTTQKLLDAASQYYKKDPSTGRVQLDVIKRAARLIANSTRLARIDANLALQKMRGANTRAYKAAARDNWKAAAVANREALLNYHVYRELTKASEARDKLVRTAQQLNGEASQGRLGKASPFYRDAARYIASALGLAHEDAETGRFTDKVDTSVLTEAAAEIQGDYIAGPERWLEPVASATATLVKMGRDYRGLTVEQAAQVQMALDNINKAAQIRNTINREQRAEEFSKVVAESVREISENKKPIATLPTTTASADASLLQKVAGAPRWLLAPLARMQTFFQWMGGSLREGRGQHLDSFIYNYGFQPIVDSTNRKSDLYKSVIEPILAAMTDPEVRDSWDNEADVSFPNHHVPSGVSVDAPHTVGHVIMMGLNMGTKSNEERLLLGRNITREEVLQALAGLTKKQIDYINAVHASFESLKEQVWALEERDSGIAPEELERQSIELPNGTIKGGYYPAVYDSRLRLPRKGQQTGAGLDRYMDPDFQREGTSRSHVKARVDGYYDAISLDVADIGVHLERQVHDLAFRENVRDVARLINNPAVHSVLLQHMGPERVRAIDNWVKNNGSSPTVPGAAVLAPITKALKAVRTGQVLGQMAFSAPNFFEDIVTGFGMAITDKQLGNSYIVKGVLDTMYGKGKGPLAHAAWVRENSPTIRAAHGNMVRDFSRQVNDLMRSKEMPFVSPAMSWLRHHAFDFIEAAFTFTATPLWTARYQQGLDEGRSHAGAVQAADDFIQLNFPFHQVAHLPALLGNKGLVANMLLFHTFWNTALQRGLTTAQTFIEAPAKEKVKSIAWYLGFLFAITIVSNLARGKGPDRPDKGPPEDWTSWAERTVLDGTFSQLPFIGGVAGNYINTRMRYSGKGSLKKAKDSRDTVGPPTIDRAIFDVLAAIDTMLHDKKMSEDKKAEVVLRALGPLLQIPGTTQGLRTTKYLHDLYTGKADPRSAFDIIHGIVNGDTSRHPESLFSLAGEGVEAVRRAAGAEPNPKYDKALGGAVPAYQGEPGGELPADDGAGVWPAIDSMLEERSR